MKPLKTLARLLFAPTQLTTDLGLLVMRLWFGLVMAIAHGIPKFDKLDRFAAGLAEDGMPIPEVMALLAALSESVGGLLIALGLLTRPAALALVVTMSVAAFVAHAEDPFAKQEFALLYGVGFLALALAGPGRLSLDHLLGRRFAPPSA